MCRCIATPTQYGDRCSRLSHLETLSVHSFPPGSCIETFVTSNLPKNLLLHLKLNVVWNKKFSLPSLEEFSGSAVLQSTVQLYSCHYIVSPTKLQKRHKASGIKKYRLVNIMIRIVHARKDGLMLRFPVVFVSLPSRNDNQINDFLFFKRYIQANLGLYSERSK